MAAACLFVYLKQKSAEAAAIINEDSLNNSNIVKDTSIRKSSRRHVPRKPQSLSRNELLQILSKIPASFPNFAWELRDDFRRWRRSLY